MPEALFQVRNGIFGLVIILSFAVVGLTAHWTQLTVAVGYFVSFEGIGLVASTLTILALSVFLIVGLFRKNATITTIAVELPTLIVLSVLFLAEGIVTNDFARENWPTGCDPSFLNSLGIQVCKEFMSLKGISFAIFGIMIAYWFPLLVMTVISLTQGQNDFCLSVREVTSSRHTLAQANGAMEQVGWKDPSRMLGDQYQQQQIQLQQLQPQQLHQQAAALQRQQQQHMQQGTPQV